VRQAIFFSHTLNKSFFFFFFVPETRGFLSTLPDGPSYFFTRDKVRVTPMSLTAFMENPPTGSFSLI